MRKSRMMITRQLQYGPQALILALTLTLNSRSVLIFILVIKYGRGTM